MIKCVLYSISQDTIINYNFTVNSDALPLTGYDPDLKVYAINEPYPEEEVDPRGYDIVKTWTRLETFHPIWATLKECRLTYTYPKLSTELLKQAVINKKAWANEMLFPFSVQTEKTAKHTWVTHKKVKKDDLDPWMEDILLEMDAIIEGMIDNDSNAVAMDSYIDAHVGDNTIPNFDEGWTTSYIV